MVQLVVGQIGVCCVVVWWVVGVVVEGAGIVLRSVRFVVGLLV